MEVEENVPPPGGEGVDDPQPASITEVLTDEELATLPENIRGKLDGWTAEIARNVKSVVTEKDSQISRLSAANEELVSRNDILKNEVAEARKNLDETGDRYRAAVTNLARVEETIIGYQKQISESQINANVAIREKDELVMVVDKRNEEVERLTESMKSLSDQLQAATVAKIEALCKIDELTGKDMELEYKGKELEREKEWVGKQVQMLNDELEKKNSEIIATQREFSIKHLQLQTELSEKNEQIKISELQLANCQKANEAQEKHIEHLITKLKDSEDIETKMQENYRQELSAQRKIADLYKESSEEASKKVEELEDAVSSLQDLLKNATSKYGELETKFAKVGKSFQDEIAEKHEQIAKIQKELENANKLIESFQSKGLTNEMIQSLSPAAAAATSMLKNSKSLTQIYSEYHDLCDEVIIKKQEINKLNQMVKELLQEIETQGPELEREKLKNQKNVEKLEVMQNQLDLALRDSEKSKAETSHANRSLGAMERENNRLRSQLNDLAMQVRSLLKETEVQRGNYSAVASRSVTSGVAEVPDIETSAQQVVSDRLVTFRNIEELQMQNQRLLAVVRELTESQEKATREAHETQLQLIKDSFQEAMRELEVLREKRMTQDKLLQSAIHQRDALAELMKQPKSPIKVPDPSAAGKLAEIQRQYEALQTAHKSVQEEFDTYKKERAEHEKIAVEQVEKLRDDVMKMRTDNAKLGSQVEYNNERAKIYNANLETYKKNINVLEERNKKYSATTLKLEQSIEMLKSELSGAQNKLARTEVALNSMTQERNSLRDTNARLQAERDILKRDQNTQQMLRLNLQEIKNGLNMSNSALKTKMENEIETLRRDNTILQRKVSTETERFKEAVFSWESANKELIHRLRNDQDSLQVTKEELENSKATIARLNGEIEDLQSQVKVLSNTTLDTVNASEDQPVTIPALERQIKDLKTQLRDAKIENETMTQHLAVSRQSAEEYRTLCGSIEGQISIVSDTSKQLTEELQQRLEGKDEIIRDIQARLSTSERETASLKDEKDTIVRDFEAKSIALEEEICRMRRDLQAANTKLQTAFEENVQVKSDLQKQTLVYQDIQEKYEKELASHSADVNTLNEMKNELEAVRLKIIDEEQARRNAENQLNQALNDWTSKGNAMKAEMSNLQENKDELEKLNNSLQDQIINLTTRLEAASKPAGESGDDASGSVEAEGQQKSSEEWLQLIRYMRREKEIAKTKTEMAEATSSRYENQIIHLQKQIEDLKRELSELQDTSHVSIITSAKQADLLRKVETLSALTDSNRMLREEKDAAVKELEELKQKVAVLDVEIGPLREKSSELEGRCEALLNENTALKQDIGRWRTRAASLLEKSNKVNPEEMKRLQTETDNLTKQVQAVQEVNRKQQLEITRNLLQVKQLQQQTLALQSTNQALQNEKKILTDEHKKVADEKEKLRAEAQTLRLEVSSLKNSQVAKDENIERANKEIENVNKLLEEQKNTVKAVKSIARKYKKQYEDLLKEQEGFPKQGQQEGSSLENVNIGDSSAVTEAQREEIAKYEAQVKQLQEEIETMKRESDTVKTDRGTADERMRAVIKTLREKLSVATAEKADVESKLNEYEAKNISMKNREEENNVRFAALKSQYEGRLVRLEKENKELKATATGNAPEFAALQQENDDLKKEQEMMKQRVAALENRFKLQSQTSKVASPEKVLPVEKAKANIRPIAGPSPKQAAVARPPLTASIRPISMPRKATVSVSAMPTQNSQASSSNIQSVSPVVAPVSQAQVSTSTPDQSSSAPESSPQQQMHQSLAVNASNVPISSAGRQAAAVQPTVTVAPVAVGLGVVGSNNSVSTPASGVSGIGGPQQQQGSSGSSSGAANDTQAAHQDPSTSSATQIMEESEMGDSSEQVSSSEGSTHQNILSVAPLRSKQHDAQQSSSSSSSIQHQPQPGPSTKKQTSTFSEEPSPSSSTLRPTQSTNKRSREDPHHSHHDDEEDLLNEPDTKRTRVMGSIVDREAEALGQQESSNDQMIEEEEEEEDEQEADQGSSAADDAQVQLSDTTTKESNVRPSGHGNDGHDSDSDVIIIDSEDDDGEVGRTSSKASTSRVMKQLPVEEEEADDVDEEDEEVGDEEEQDDEEDLMEEEDDVDEDDEDHGDDDDGQEGKKMDEEDYDDVEDQEGREAESLEHDDNEIQEVDNSHDDDQDILDSNDSNLNPMDFSSQDQSNQQHELREAEQSIDDEGLEDGELVPEPIVSAPVAGTSSSLTASGSPIRPPREFNTRPQSISTPMRVTPAGRGSLPPQLGRQQPQLTPSFSSGQYADDADDSIVPSTPTLFVPRRSDGFAEAVSSPQIQPGGRFTFSSVAVSATESSSSGVHAGTSASSSGNVLDDTRLDFLGYDEGGGSGTTGRSVPSTPLQVSPPVEGLELAAEMAADDDAAQEEALSAAIIVDVHPTSSSIASISGSDVPAITVTSAMESSSRMSFQPPQEGTSKGTLDPARLAAMGSQQRTSTQSEVSNVTSSDEDKVLVAGTSSSSNTGSMQRPSTSSRAASPTPSSNTSNPPTEQKEPLPQPQHHHHHHQQQQGGRTRPTPIVWDQPSSSSSANPTSRPARGGMMGGRGGGTMAVRHMIQPDQGHIMPPMLRGGYRPMMMMRGQNQSARRSRPHSRGGPSGGVGPGNPGPGPGSVGGRMPFQKPY